MPGKQTKKPVNDQEGLTMILNRLDQLEQNMNNGFQQVDQHHQEALNTWTEIHRELQKCKAVDDELHEKIRQLQDKVDVLSAE